MQVAPLHYKKWKSTELFHSLLPPYSKKVKLVALAVFALYSLSFVFFVFNRWNHIKGTLKRVKALANLFVYRKKYDESISFLKQVALKNDTNLTKENLNTILSNIEVNELLIVLEQFFEEQRNSQATETQNIANQDLSNNSEHFQILAWLYTDPDKIIDWLYHVPKIQIIETASWLLQNTQRQVLTKSFSFRWSLLSFSGSFHYLLLASAFSTSVLTRIWKRHPEAMKVLEGILKDYLPINFHLGLDHFYIIYVARRLMERCSSMLEPFETLFSEINQKYQLPIDIFHLFIATIYFYKRFREPPAVQTSIIPPHLLSAKVVPCCTNLNSLASMGRFNEFEMRSEHIQDISLQLNSNKGVFITGKRKSGISTLVKCLAQDAILTPKTQTSKRAFFQLDIDSVLESKGIIFQLFGVKTEQTTEVLGKVISHLIAKVENPILVLDDLQLWEEGGTGEKTYELLRTLINQLTKLDRDKKIKLLVTYSTEREYETDPVFDKYKKLFVEYANLREITIPHPSQQAAAEILQRIFCSVDNIPFIIDVPAFTKGSFQESTQEFTWEKVYDWVELCYPNAPILQKSIDLVGEALQELRNNFNLIKARLPDSFLAVVSKKISKLQELLEKSHESSHNLTQIKSLKTPNLFNTSEMYNFSLEYLLLELVLIPQQKEEVRSLREALKKYHDKIFFDESFFVSFLQRKRNLLLGPVNLEVENLPQGSSQEQEGKTKVERVYLPALELQARYPDKHDLIHRLLEPFLRLSLYNPMISLNRSLDHKQERFPITYFIPPYCYHSGLELIEYFVKNLQRYLKLPESIVEVELVESFSFNDFQKAYFSQKSNFLTRLASCPHTIVVFRQTHLIKKEDVFKIINLFKTFKAGKEIGVLGSHLCFLFFMDTSDDLIASSETEKDIKLQSISKANTSAKDEDLTKHICKVLNNLAENFLLHQQIEFGWEDGVVDFLLANIKEQNIALEKVHEHIAAYFELEAPVPLANEDDKAVKIVLSKIEDKLVLNFYKEESTV